MARKRANGEGNIRKRKDGRWEGRYTAGHDPESGKAIYKNVLGRTQAEVKSKLKAAIEKRTAFCCFATRFRQRLPLRNCGTENKNRAPGQGAKLLLF